MQSGVASQGNVLGPFLYSLCILYFVNAANFFGFGRVFGARFQIDGTAARNYDDGARRGQLARSTFIRRSVFGLI
jgi:hypothetical protein